MEFIREQGAAATIILPLLDPSTGEYKTGLVPFATGDVKYVIHSGGTWQAAANTAALPAEIAPGVYALDLAAAELNPDDRRYPVAVTFVDQSNPKLWRDDTALVFFDAKSGPRARMLAAYTSTAGNELRFLAWVEQDGKRIPLGATASCSIAIWEHGAGAASFTVTDGAAGPNANDLFELTKTTPGLTDDRAYYGLITITDGSRVFDGIEAFPVFG